MSDDGERWSPGSTTWRDADFLQPDEPVDTTTCEREPIHLIGAAQPNSAIVVVDDGRIVQATRNVSELVGTEVSVGDALTDVPALAGVTGPNGEPLLRSVRGLDVEIRATDSPTGPLVVEISEVVPVEWTLGDAVATISTLRSAEDLPTLCRRAASAVRALIGFDRVWIYRFDRDWNGEVLAEDRRTDLAPFLGLHFDSGDIPPQARALFLEERVRLIRDATGASSPLVPPQLADGRWTDLSAVRARAVSPMHLQYLANLGVQASMSIAIVVDGRLWGLCSAHHYDGPRLLGSDAETMARLLGEVVSLQVGALARADADARTVRLQQHAVAVLAGVAGADSVLGGLADEPNDLTALGAADGVTVRIAGRVRSFGLTPAGAELDAMFDALDGLVDDDGPSVRRFDRFTDLVPGATESPVGGAMALLLSKDAGNWIVWFRPPLVTTISWGDPMADGDELTPEHSFRIFTETVRGRCERWGDVEANAVEELKSALGALVMQRSEQLARTVEALRAANAELDRFSYVAAHDLKEPLRGIHNYADVLLEEIDDPDETVRHCLTSLQRLSRRMTGLVDGLLDYATIGRNGHDSRPVAVADLVADAVEFVRQRLDERDGEIRCVSDAVVYGSRDQLVQLLTNLFSNAIKYTAPGRAPRIEVDVVGLGDTRRGWTGWPQHNIDLPPPMVLAVRDNGIGVIDADRERIFEVFRRGQGSPDYGDGVGAGLPIARRIAERHGGAIWVEPNDPQGSVFYIALQRPDGLAVSTT